MTGGGKTHAQGPVLVSACLLGLETRWDGTGQPCDEFLRTVGSGRLIPVCPEQLGGLPTPRVPAEIEDGDGWQVLDGAARVVARDGRDVTENYLRGARQALRIAELSGVWRAILKEGSPACGVCRIKRAGRDVKGMGVTAALLAREGVDIEGVG